MLSGLLLGLFASYFIDWLILVNLPSWIMPARKLCIQMGDLLLYAHNLVVPIDVSLLEDCHRIWSAHYKPSKKPASKDKCFLRFESWDIMFLPLIEILLFNMGSWVEEGFIFYASLFGWSPKQRFTELRFPYTNTAKVRMKTGMNANLKFSGYLIYKCSFELNCVLLSLHCFLSKTKIINLKEKLCLSIVFGGPLYGSWLHLQTINVCRLKTLKLENTALEKKWYVIIV